MKRPVYGEGWEGGRFRLFVGRVGVRQRVSVAWGWRDMPSLIIKRGLAIVNLHLKLDMHTRLKLGST